jgi:hypothetical protein
MAVAITASEVRRALLSLIVPVNDDCASIEVTAKRGNALLMSANDLLRLARDCLSVPLAG